MWILTLIATATGAGGLVLGVRNYLHLRQSKIRDNQWEIRKDLRSTLRIIDYHQLRHYADRLKDGSMPPTTIEEDLRQLHKYLVQHQDEFIAPTPQQLESLIAATEVVIDNYVATRQPPTNDDMFKEGFEAGQCKRLLDDLNVIRGLIKATVDGVTAIEKKPLSVKKQVAQFKALDSKNQKAIEG